jgi:heterodisulfide reductase subunit B
VEDHIQRDGKLKGRINEALAEEDLTYHNGKKVRHLLDVLANDFDHSHIAALVKRPLSELVVAPYYGCQALRPYCEYDDPQEPRSMEPLIKALGAEVYPWTVGAKCCGAALMTTKKDVALELTGGILKAAQGADCIATICPMCQMNLEAFQAAISHSQGVDLGISILYLPQLMGLAFGLSAKDLQLHLNLAVMDGFKEKVGI